MKSKLSKYAGGLSSAQIACGMDAAERNARRLADDAKLLLDAGRYPTAFTLAVLSIEESGKTAILRSLAFAPNTEWSRVWQEYRSHRKKNVQWTMPTLVASGARDLESLAPAADVSAEHTVLLDDLKQVSLYTDRLGDAHWSEPENVIDGELAKHLVSIADKFAKGSSTTTKEIKLWEEHMAPVYGAPLDVMKAALMNWFSAMEENGLYVYGKISAEEFIFGKVAGSSEN